MSYFRSFLLPFFVLIVALNLSAQSQYSGKPRYEILATQNNSTLGIIRLEMFQNIAPYHVRNFDSLVSKKFYDTTAFHRVVPGFVIQGGDPNSRSGPVSSWGFGQSSQPTVKAEFSVARHERGILSAARSNNINSATSQFFICVAQAASLNNNYSVYGRVTSGMNVVDQIVNSSTVTGTQRPVNKVEMFIRFIGVNDTVPQPPILIRPRNDSSSVDTTVVTLQWTTVQDGIIYHVDIARDSLFTDTVKSVDLAGVSYNATFLPARQKYYWKIKVNNGGFYRDSEIRHFTTKGYKPPVPNTTSLSKGIIEDRQVLVFPNPSKDRFKFSNLRVGQLLVITDLSGRMIQQVVVERSEMVIDLSAHSRGHYLFKVYEGAEVISKGQLIVD